MYTDKFTSEILSNRINEKELESVPKYLTETELCNNKQLQFLIIVDF